MIILIAIAMDSSTSIALSHISNQADVEEKSEKSNNESIDTSSWRIYENEKYGFLFKYPQEQNCQERQVEWQIVALNINCKSFSLTIYSNPRNLPMRNFFLSENVCVQDKPLCQYFMNNLSPETQKIEGAKTFEVQIATAKPIPRVLISHDYYIFKFTNEFTENTAIFDYIVSTLSFLSD